MHIDTVRTSRSSRLPQPLRRTPRRTSPGRQGPDSIDQGRVADPGPWGCATASRPSPCSTRLTNTTSTPPSVARAATRTRPRQGTNPVVVTRSPVGPSPTTARTLAALPGQVNPGEHLRLSAVGLDRTGHLQYIEREEMELRRSTSPRSRRRAARPDVARRGSSSNLGRREDRTSAGSLSHRG